MVSFFGMNSYPAIYKLLNFFGLNVTYFYIKLRLIWNNISNKSSKGAEYGKRKQIYRRIKERI